MGFISEMPFSWGKRRKAVVFMSCFPNGACETIGGLSNVLIVGREMVPAQAPTINFVPPSPMDPGRKEVFWETCT